MNEGFFDDDLFSLPSQAPPSLVARCGTCGLYKHCLSPKMPVSGKGKLGILLVGEAPGRVEDKKNLQFVGKTGQRLRRELESLDINPETDCWFYNSIICRPTGEDGKDRAPTKKEIDYCRPNLIKIIEQLKPNVIIPLGNAPLNSLLGWLFRKEEYHITKWAGFRIPNQHPNIWICPTFHPSFVERQEEKIVDLWWHRHLKSATRIREKPWSTPPNFREQVQVVFEEDIIVRELEGFIRCKLPVAFDFETTCKKADSEQAEIVCCSVSNGSTTIAFPWVGKAIQVMKKLLLDKGVPKRGQNLKFEHRWSRAKLGIEIRGWQVDDMLMQHVIDNRSGVTGIEFQACIYLGQPPWDSEISPYLRSKGGGNAQNRVRECDMQKLCQYCGMDSLLEWKVAEKHQQLFKKNGMLRRM